MSILHLHKLISHFHGFYFASFCFRSMQSNVCFSFYVWSDFNDVKWINLHSWHRSIGYGKIKGIFHFSVFSVLFSLLMIFSINNLTEISLTQLCTWFSSVKMRAKYEQCRKAATENRLIESFKKCWVLWSNWNMCFAIRNHPYVQRGDRFFFVSSPPSLFSHFSKT